MKHQLNALGFKMNSKKSTFIRANGHQWMMTIVKMLYWLK